MNKKQIQQLILKKIHENFSEDYVVKRVNKY